MYHFMIGFTWVLTLAWAMEYHTEIKAVLGGLIG